MMIPQPNLEMVMWCVVSLPSLFLSLSLGLSWVYFARVQCSVLTVSGTGWFEVGVMLRTWKCVQPLNSTTFHDKPCPILVFLGN